MAIKEKFTVERIYPFILTIGGVLGLVAMTWQAIERINMLKNPTQGLSCNLNPIVDCSGVLSDRLAAVLGFPNAFLGMIFFTILATSGLMMLSGTKFTSWYRHFVMVVLSILLLFSIWFFGVSLYVLGKICVFCVVGWVVSVPMFWYGLLYYLQTANGRIKDTTAAFTKFGLKYHLDVLIMTFALMFFLFLFRFRDYYFN